MKNDFSKRVLIVSPHPDDDVIGCGGTIKKFLLEGKKILVVYLTLGEAGSWEKYSVQQLKKIREKEAKSALSILQKGTSGKIDSVFLDGGDGYLSRYNSGILDNLTKIIREFKPHYVFLPHHRESHFDHQETYYLTKKAISHASSPCFPEIKIAPWFGIEMLLLYEVWTPLQDFQLVIDITEVKEEKKKAILTHQSQQYNQNFSEGILGLNQYRGIMTGKGKWAEVFKIEGTIVQEL